MRVLPQEPFQPVDFLASRSHAELVALAMLLIAAVVVIVLIVGAADKAVAVVRRDGKGLFDLAEEKKAAQQARCRHTWEFHNEQTRKCSLCEKAEAFVEPLEDCFDPLPGWTATARHRKAYSHQAGKHYVESEYEAVEVTPAVDGTRPGRGYTSGYFAGKRLTHALVCRKGGIYHVTWHESLRTAKAKRKGGSHDCSQRKPGFTAVGVILVQHDPENPLPNEGCVL